MTQTRADADRRHDAFVAMWSIAAGARAFGDGDGCREDGR